MIKNNKYLIIAAVLIFGIIAMVFLFKNNPPKDISQSASVANSSDVIRIFVKGGYSPDKITAKAGIPLTLQLVTKSTFDCSANVIIKALGVNEYLKATGEFNVKIPPQEKGTSINGTCGMGMYSFEINFE